MLIKKHSVFKKKLQGIFSLFYHIYMCHIAFPVFTIQRCYSYSKLCYSDDTVPDGTQNEQHTLLQ